MALTKRQKQRLANLQAKKDAGTIGDIGLKRLKALRKQQAAQGKVKTVRVNKASGGGGKKKGKKGLKINKPKNVIKKQRKENIGAAEDTLKFQNPQQFNPFGSREYTIDENGNVVMTDTLSGPQQEMLDYQNQFNTGLYGDIADNYGSMLQDAYTPFDFGSLPDAPGTQDLAAERTRIEDELYGKYTQGFDEQKAQEKDALEQRLAERGIMPGSGELYKNTMADFEENWSNRYDAARQNAVSAGGQEWARTYDIGRTGRADALREQQFGKQFGVNQLGGLLGLGSGINYPNFQQFQGTQVGPVDITGTSLGYYQTKTGNKLTEQQLNQQKQIADADRAAQIQIAGMNSGGGGAPQGPPSLPPPPPVY